MLLETLFCILQETPKTSIVIRGLDHNAYYTWRIRVQSQTLNWIYVNPFIISKGKQKGFQAEWSFRLADRFS